MPHHTADSTADVLVVGAGAIGTACAWRLAQRGTRVVVVDPDPGRGAWHTAAGMLAPITELHFTEDALLRLNLASMAAYPDFVTELTDSTGLPTGYAECGTVEAAWDAADLQGLRDLHEFGNSLGLVSTMLTGRELRELEPALAAGMPGGLLAEFDHQVDPRLLHEAQLQAGLALGVRLVRSAVRTLDEGRAELADGSHIDAGTVVLAAGAWSRALAPVPVRPVKGQTLRLRLPGPPRLSRVVRAEVSGSPIYVVPRADGRVVVGASSEERGFDRTPRAGAVYELLRDAQCVVPELGEAELEEVCTGLRPGSTDNAPLIGRLDEHTVIASGHYRNGILLTPITAAAVAALVLEDSTLDAVSAFGPERHRSEAGTETR